MGLGAHWTEDIEMIGEIHCWSRAAAETCIESSFRMRCELGAPHRFLSAAAGASCLPATPILLQSGLSRKCRAKTLEMGGAKRLKTLYVLYWLARSGRTLSAGSRD